MKRCGDQDPTSKKNSSRDPQAMTRASSSPRLCLPLLLVVIAAVFVALPVAACAGSSNDAAGDSTGPRRMPAPEAQKEELLGEEGAPSQRRAITVGQTTPIPRFASRPHHAVNPHAVPTPSTLYPPATESCSDGMVVEPPHIDPSPPRCGSSHTRVVAARGTKQTVR